MSEFFGYMPNRPDHPDLWLLSNVVLKLDSGIDTEHNTEEQNEAAWEARIAEVGIDKQSLIYVANQRALRALAVENRVDLLAKFPQVALLTSVWIEAFSAGVLVERERGEAT